MLFRSTKLRDSIQKSFSEYTFTDRDWEFLGRIQRLHDNGNYRVNFVEYFTKAAFKELGEYLEEIIV